MMTRLLTLALMVGLETGAIAIQTAAAQELPPIFADTPVELVPHQTVTTLPVNTFLENLVVDETGTLYITSHEDGKIIRLQPDGTQTVFAIIEGKVAGIAIAPDGSLLVSGATQDQVPAIFRISVDGVVEILATLPDAIFLNGLTRLMDDRYLIADSYRGAIWELDVSQRSIRLWLEHPLLTRRTTDSPIPAINGLKRFQGILYVSNTDRMTLLQIPLDDQGEPGEPEIIAEQVNIDDFALDRDGNLYGATHIYNSVVRLTPDRQLTVIAQGVTGSTAIAFGRTASDRTAIYVVTNGGMFLPPPTGVEPAEVVRLEVNQSADCR